MTTTVSSKGQIVLPAEIRQQDDVKPGQKFEIERIDRGEYRLVHLSNSIGERLTAGQEVSRSVRVRNSGNTALRAAEGARLEVLVAPTKRKTWITLGVERAH